MLKFNNIVLLESSIIQCRQWFADNAQACINEVLDRSVKVNDSNKYFAWQKQRIVDSLAGKNDHTVTFLQRCYYIQTGECLALLPK